MLNASIKSKKLQFILQDSGAKVIITSLRHAPVLEKALCDQLELQHIIWCKSDNAAFSDNNLVSAERTRVTHVPWAQVLDSATHDRRVSQGIDVDLAAIIYTIILNALPLAFDHGLYSVIK